MGSVNLPPQSPRPISSVTPQTRVQQAAPPQSPPQTQESQQPKTVSKPTVTNRTSIISTLKAKPTALRQNSIVNRPLQLKTLSKHQSTEENHETRESSSSDKSEKTERSESRERTEQPQDPQKQEQVKEEREQPKHEEQPREREQERDGQRQQGGQQQQQQQGQNQGQQQQQQQQQQGQQQRQQQSSSESQSDSEDSQVQGISASSLNPSSSPQLSQPTSEQRRSSLMQSSTQQTPIHVQQQMPQQTTSQSTPTPLTRQNALRNVLQPSNTLAQRLGMSKVLEPSTRLSVRSSRYAAAAQTLQGQAQEKRQEASKLKNEASKLAFGTPTKPMLDRANGLMRIANSLETQAKDLDQEASFMQKASEDLSFGNSPKADKLRQFLPAIATTGLQIGMKFHNAVVEGGNLVEVVKNTAISSVKEGMVYGSDVLSTVAGVTGIVTAGAELYDGYKNCKKLAAGMSRKEEAKALLMTHPERVQVMTKVSNTLGSAQRELAALDQTKHPKKAAKLKALIETSQAKFEGLKQMNAQGVSKESQAIAKQVMTRQGLKLKCLKILKNAAAVTLGVMAGLALAGLATTPVGWAVLGVAAVGIGCLVYSKVKEKRREMRVQNLQQVQYAAIENQTKIKSEISHFENTLSEQRNELQVAKNKPEPDQDEITGLQSKISKSKERLSSLQKSLQNADDDVAHVSLALLSKSPKAAMENMLNGLRQGNSEAKYILETVLKISPAERLLTMDSADALELINRNGLSLSPSN